MQTPIKLSLFLGFLTLASFATAKVATHDLRTEYLTNPIQLDTKKPRLSWKLKPANAGARNISQKAYQVLVASSEDLLVRDKGDLWDSGRVDSDQSILVRYAGSELKSLQRCFWKVRVWDQDGQPSEWSETVSWELAFLDAKDWSGSEWIGHDKDTRDSEHSARLHLHTKKELDSNPSPLLRKEIGIDKEIRSARAYVSGVGYFELYINGKRVGDHVLDPGQTNYDKHTLYVTHDITEHLTSGNNALGFWLGNGFYGQSLAFDPKFEYVKRWVPEYGTPAYPQPIIEHTFARNRVLDRFKTALNKTT